MSNVDKMIAVAATAATGSLSTAQGTTTLIENTTTTSFFSSTCPVAMRPTPPTGFHQCTPSASTFFVGIRNFTIPVIA